MIAFPVAPEYWRDPRVKQVVILSSLKRDITIATSPDNASNAYMHGLNHWQCHKSTPKQGHVVVHVLNDSVS